jgi:hypothetical protein
MSSLGDPRWLERPSSRNLPGRSGGCSSSSSQVSLSSSPSEREGRHRRRRVGQLGTPLGALGECGVEGPFVSHQTTRVARLLCLEHSGARRRVGGGECPPPPPPVEKEETRNPETSEHPQNGGYPPRRRKSRAPERAEPQKEPSLRKKSG